MEGDGLHNIDIALNAGGGTIVLDSPSGGMVLLTMTSEQ